MAASRERPRGGRRRGEEGGKGEGEEEEEEEGEGAGGGAVGGGGAREGGCHEKT